MSNDGLSVKQCFRNLAESAAYSGTVVELAALCAEFVDNSRQLGEVVSIFQVMALEVTDRQRGQGYSQVGTGLRTQMATPGENQPEMDIDSVLSFFESVTAAARRTNLTDEKKLAVQSMQADCAHIRLAMMPDEDCIDEG